MNELPNINSDSFNADPATAAVPRNRPADPPSTTSTPIVLGVAAAVVFSAVIATVITLSGHDSVKQLFGFTPPPDPTVKLSKSVDEITAHIARLSLDVERLLQSQATIKAEMAQLKSDDHELTSRIEQLRNRAADVEKTIAAQKKVAPVAKVMPKTEPKPQAITPINLVSIRNLSGTPYVSVSEGLDNSGLLMPGDVWHGWTFLDADPASKSAVFVVNGVRQELRL